MREAMWGTVENPAKVGRTPWSAAGPLASLPRVFIAFGGPQGHDDRLVACGGLSIRLPLAPGNPPGLKCFMGQPTPASEASPIPRNIRQKFVRRHDCLPRKAA